MPFLGQYRAWRRSRELCRGEKERSLRDFKKKQESKFKKERSRPGASERRASGALPFSPSFSFFSGFRGVMENDETVLRVHNDMILVIFNFPFTFINQRGG